MPLVFGPAVLVDRPPRSWRALMRCLGSIMVSLSSMLGVAKSVRPAPEVDCGRADVGRSEPPEAAQAQSGRGHRWRCGGAPRRPRSASFGAPSEQLRSSPLKPATPSRSVQMTSMRRFEPRGQGPAYSRGSRTDGTCPPRVVAAEPDTNAGKFSRSLGTVMTGSPRSTMAAGKLGAEVLKPIPVSCATSESVTMRTASGSQPRWRDAHGADRWRD